MEESQEKFADQQGKQVGRHAEFRDGKQDDGQCDQHGDSMMEKYGSRFSQSV